MKLKRRKLGKLGRRLFLSILISSIIITILSIFSAYAIRQALNENIRGQRALDSIGDTVIIVYESLIDQETGLRGYIITDETSFLEPYNQGVENFNKLSKELIEKSKKYPEIVKEIDKFIDSGNKWREDYASKIFEMIKNEETPSDEFMLEGKAISDEFREHSANLTQLIEGERTVVRNTMNKKINLTLMSLVGFTSIVMLINVLIYYNILSAVIKPLIRLSQCVKSYADHHFNMQVPEYNKNDELKALIDNVDIMREELSKSINSLETKAMIDDLTKLHNRRYFNEIYGDIWEEAKRKKTPLSIMIFDIDHYKYYNDTYGHLKGDECLKEISKYLISLNDPPNRYIARFGGEEFVLLALNIDEKSAYNLAEDIRKSIRELAIPHEGSLVDDVVTISVGLVTVLPTDDIKPEKAISVADEALYLSKQNGRNQVTRLQV